MSLMGNVIETITGTTTYNVLNDVTATPFSVSFSQLPTVKKNTKNGAAVMSLRRSYVVVPLEVQ
jgi:hypothetical protein